MAPSDSPLAWSVFWALFWAPLLSAKQQGSFRWEGFSNIADLKRHLLGGCLMGVGAVMAIGCSIGQGLSGVSTLNILSILATLAILMGAFIALQYDLKRAD
jgi:uncharacterized protein